MTKIPSDACLVTFLVPPGDTWRCVCPSQAEGAGEGLGCEDLGLFLRNVWGRAPSPLPTPWKKEARPRPGSHWRTPSSPRPTQLYLRAELRRANVTWKKGPRATVQMTGHGAAQTVCGEGWLGAASPEGRAPGPGTRVLSGRRGLLPGGR